jgi:hypothetical protein
MQKINLTIATTKIASAMQASGTNDIDLSDRASMSINLANCEVRFLQALMAEDLTKKQREKIVLALGDVSDVLDMTVGTLRDLFRAVKTLHQPEEPTVEILIHSRWHPIPLSRVDLFQNAMFGNGMVIESSLQVADQQMGERWSFSDATFRDSEGNARTWKVRDLLQQCGLRPTTPEAVAAYKDRLQRAQELEKKAAQVMATTNGVLVPNNFLFGNSLDSISLGTEESPRQCIVEPELECRQNHHRGGYYGYEQGPHPLPFVRLFSLDLKRYVYGDVDDLVAWDFDKNATDRLVLPEEMHKLLTTVFKAHTKGIFGDLFRGRHGGMVMLANGPSGVGKTLTAEVFAEVTGRPLYVLEMGELGTDLDKVEASLQLIFARAARWNAVLLFDEADVFLAKRNEGDLERSAIVGVFLRLLDRYEGMFFLTTNRAEVIDPAFQSRITLKMDYPQLSQGSRQTIWQYMLESAGLPVEGDLGVVAEKGINGRQIRNQVRLLKLIHPEGCTTDQVLDCLQYIAN